MDETPRPVAVVTGASSGIGASIARMLAERGFQVILVARRRDRLEELAADLTGAGGSVECFSADLSHEEDCQQLYEAVRGRWGAVDVLVNNAGLGWYGFGEEIPWPTARQMIEVNMAAVARLTILFLSEMKRRGKGHIINIGSIAGSFPNQGVALYSATKSFIDAFTTGLYRELRGTAVHISVVRAGAVATPFFDEAEKKSNGLRIPVDRLAVAPEKVARRVVSLLRRPARVAYVPGYLFFVPWVELLFGWIVDRLGPLLLRFQLRRQQR
jgi:hypothetical protein